MATDMFFGASPELFSRAKALRNTMTSAEKMLWERLQKKQLNGFRFKPQHPIASFVADFYCHAARLIVEVDGAVHDSPEQKSYDANRTYMLEEFDLRVMRFRNEEIEQSIDNVLSRIAAVLVYPLPPEGGS